MFESIVPRAGRRGVIAVVCLGMLMAACGSSSPTAGSKTHQETASGPSGTVSGQATTTTVAGSPTTQAAGVAGNSLASGGSSGGLGGGQSGSNGASSGGGQVAGGTGGGTVSGFHYTPAHLWSGAAETQGITASTITLCMHAATVLGDAFNERPQDLGVYWTWLNANGGVIGRKVNMTIEDDEYTAQGAQVAAQECESLNPFLVLGGIGFDQDPVVRQLAEQDHFIYIYTMADAGTGHYTYSFTSSPTIQQVGKWVAQAELDRHYPGPYGAVYVNDAAWVGGYTTYKAWMDAHGGKSVDQNSYTTNSGGDTSGFQAYITELKVAGVKTVYLWMNALAMDAFVEQAANQGYYPAYVTPDGFNLVTQTVGKDIDNQSPAPKPTLAAWITPAFDPNNPNVAWWPEEQQMINVYKQYDAGHSPDDIDWMTWLAFEQITDLLKTCGNNCTRDDIVGIFHSGWQVTTGPLCPVNFSSNPNFGGSMINLFSAYRENGSTVWRQQATCQSSF